jgi:hypothetical protein
MKKDPVGEIVKVAQQWAVTNDKRMTVEQFEKQNPGYTFSSFLEKHRGPALYAWRQMIKERATRNKPLEKVTGADLKALCFWARVGVEMHIDGQYGDRVLAYLSDYYKRPIKFGAQR